MLRLVKDQMRRKSEDEFRMELTGQFMALFASANSKKEWKRQDFFQLSYDKPVIDERPLTFKEAKALLGSRIKRDGK
jgi:hypothetical protein